jgi:hypothetical protein
MFGEAYKLWNSLLCSLFQPPATSSLLGRTHILLSTLFSDTPNQCSSSSVRNLVSHPYKTGKVIVLCILTFKFLRGASKTKYSEQNITRHSLNLICS